MSDDLFSVDGQLVLVSGGSRGIGKAIARGFAERGAKVIITGRDEAVLRATAEEIRRHGSVAPVVCDVADSHAIEAMVQQVKDDWGPIDTLVNVAGVNRRKPAISVTEDNGVRQTRRNDGWVNRTTWLAPASFSLRARLSF